MKRLKSKLLAKYGTQCANPRGKCFDWEPLEVLTEMLRESGGEATIGGAPPGLVAGTGLPFSLTGLHARASLSNAFFASSFPS